MTPTEREIIEQLLNTTEKKVTLFAGVDINEIDDLVLLRRIIELQEDGYQQLLKRHSESLRGALP